MREQCRVSELQLALPGTAELQLGPCESWFLWLKIFDKLDFQARAGARRSQGDSELELAPPEFSFFRMENVVAAMGGI